jgi:hypothetical protein
MYEGNGMFPAAVMAIVMESRRAHNLILAPAVCLLTISWNACRAG